MHCRIKLQNLAQRLNGCTRRRDDAISFRLAEAGLHDVDSDLRTGIDTDPANLAPEQAARRTSADISPGLR